MTLPAVSVVVPVYNGARTIAACLDAIGRQDYQGEREVVVVDNGSTDDSWSICSRYSFARLIKCATRGPAAARNAGIAATRHEIIAFTDSDCIPSPGWLSGLIATWSPDLAAVGGRLVSAGSGKVEDVVAAISFDQHDANTGALPYVITANCLFRRTALAGVGGFDEFFPIAGGEDTDLGWRLVQAGERFAYAPGALCLHNHPARLIDLVSQRMRYGYAMSLLWTKYRGTALRPKLAAIVPHWWWLCLTLTQQPAPERRGHRGLYACADLAFFAGWAVGGGPRHVEGTGGFSRRTKRSEERRVGNECDQKCRSRWSPDH
jgi:GT2 family glycosyltransferase